MKILNHSRILNTLTRHETLTIDDIAKEENLGMVPDKQRLQLLLDELKAQGYLDTLDGVEPCTYTITQRGIVQGVVIDDDNNK